MKDTPQSDASDELRPEYNLPELAPGVRGKYYAAANYSNVVVIDPDLATIFPTSEEVNRALRALVQAARTSVPTKARLDP